MIENNENISQKKKTIEKMYEENSQRVANSEREHTGHISKMTMNFLYACGAGAIIENIPQLLSSEIVTKAIPQLLLNESTINAIQYGDLCLCTWFLFETYLGSAQCITSGNILREEKKINLKMKNLMEKNFLLENDAIIQDGSSPQPL